MADITCTVVTGWVCNCGCGVSVFVFEGLGMTSSRAIEGRGDSTVIGFIGIVFSNGIIRVLFHFLVSDSFNDSFE